MPENQSPDEVWVTPLSDQCLDDITLPPGGLSDRPAQNTAQPGALQAIPRPDYLSHEGRDLRIDLLRGYFVFAMIIDHVRGASPLYLLTGGNQFYTSAAEGFILTSGLVSGLVYRRLIQRDGMAPTLLKVILRAITLYLLTVGITLAFTLFSEIAFLPWAQGISFSNPLAFVISVFTLHQTYYLIDVMLLYTVLFLVSPLAFILLDRGKVWLLLGGSVTLYGLYQFFPELVSLPWPIEGNYLFSFSAWQVLFFAGLTLGYFQQYIPALGCRETRIGLWVSAIGLVLLIGVFYVVDTPTNLMPQNLAFGSPLTPEVRLWIQDNLFSKADVRPGRLLASAITFSFLFFCATHFWKVLKRWTAWLLLPLGQYALYAYALHIAVTGLVALALKPFALPYPGPQGLNALIQAGSVMLIWYLAKHQIGAPNARTRKFWNYSPAVLGLLIVVLLWRFPLPEHPGLVQDAPKDPGTSRVPRRYGTPAPKVVLAPAATPQPGGLPTPTVSPAPVAAVTEVPYPTTLPGTDILTSPYLGPIQGSVRERWFYSPELDRDMPYYVYLPPNYSEANRRYPVLYMLHGRGGHREEWLAYGFIDTVDQEINDGRLLPLIVVLPQGDKEYWANHTNDGPRWGEYVAHDLVAHIDATYRTLRSPASRAIGGLSMGGWGALHHAFTHPELFGIAGAHSPSLRPDDGTLAFLGSGEEFAQKDPLSLAKTAPGIEKLQVWIDIGEEDTWAAQAELLHEALAQRGVEHVWQVYAGGHVYDYWRQHALDYVLFYGNALMAK